MWSSRSSILKTVLEMADTWHFANKKKTNLSRGACLQDGALGQSRAKTFPKTFPSPKGGSGYF